MKGRRKVFAQATGFVRVGTGSAKTSQRLVRALLLRDDFVAVLSGEGKVISQFESTMQLKIVYRVHGGWPDDLRKKIQASAKLEKVILTDGPDVRNMSRQHLPFECEKVDCLACQKARILQSQGLRVPSEVRV